MLGGHMKRQELSWGQSQAFYPPPFFWSHPAALRYYYRLYAQISLLEGMGHHIDVGI